MPKKLWQQTANKTAAAATTRRCNLPRCDMYLLDTLAVPERANSNRQIESTHTQADRNAHTDTYTNKHTYIHTQIYTPHTLYLCAAVFRLKIRRRKKEIRAAIAKRLKINSPWKVSKIFEYILSYCFCRCPLFAVCCPLSAPMWLYLCSGQNWYDLP